MCQAEILLQGISDSSENKGPCFAINDKIADILKLLLYRVYGEHDHIIISNIRLFALLVIVDIGTGERSGETVTSGRWKRGKATPYPVDYHDYLKVNGWFTEKKGDFSQEFLENIWQSKSRVIFDISFTDPRRDGVDVVFKEFPPATEETIVGICTLLKGIGDPLGAVFNKPYDPMASVSEWENGYFKEIDREIILCAYSLEPLRKSDVEIDGDIDLLGYVKRAYAQNRSDMEETTDIKETSLSSSSGFFRKRSSS